MCDFWIWQSIWFRVLLNSALFNWIILYQHQSSVNQYCRSKTQGNIDYAVSSGAFYSKLYVILENLANLHGWVIPGLWYREQQMITYSCAFSSHVIIGWCFVASNSENAIELFTGMLRRFKKSMLRIAEQGR